MTPEALKTRIKRISEDAEVEVVDLTGTQDHYEATIRSSAFRGKLPIDQHRMVFELLKEELASGEVHALKLKTSAIGE